MHSSQGWVDWFRSIFMLDQGGLERAVRNNDQPRVQHDIAATNLVLDQSNAAWSNHCSADHWVLAVVYMVLKSQPAHPVLHTCAQQSQVLEFRRMARQPTIVPNPNTNLSPYFRFYSTHSSQGWVDWFQSIFKIKALHFLDHLTMRFV
jgi:hypothetical protein